MAALDSDRIKDKARALGFDLAGIAPVGPSSEADFYPEWVGEGYAGTMRYLETGMGRRLDPAEVLPGARTVIVCALNYHSDQPLTGHNRERAWVSRYAWGDDYHAVLGRKLDELARRVRELEKQLEKSSKNE